MGEAAVERKAGSWSVEVEPEVEAWLVSLAGADVDRAVEQINRLEDFGAALHLPHARHLRGRLWELRFILANRETRITYYLVGGHRIILLTVFTKQRQNERAEVDRAYQVMLRCIRDHDHEQD